MQREYLGLGLFIKDPAIKDAVRDANEVRVAQDKPLRMIIVNNRVQ